VKSRENQGGDLKLTPTVAILFGTSPIAVSGNRELLAHVAREMLESARQQQIHERTVRRALRQLAREASNVTDLAAV